MKSSFDCYMCRLDKAVFVTNGYRVCKECSKEISEFIHKMRKIKNEGKSFELKDMP